MKLEKINSEEIKMNSIEIAEKTGKQHKHVLADIKKMLIQLNIYSAEFTAQYKDASGKLNPMYILPERECLILASGYNVKLRASIIDELARLKNNKQLSIPQTLPEALKLAADLAEKNAIQEEQIKALEPKAELADTLMIANESISIGQFARATGKIGQNKLFELLREQGYLMTTGDRRNTPYQRHIDSKLFEVIEIPFQKGDNTGISFKTLITPKGQSKLIKLIK